MSDIFGGTTTTVKRKKKKSEGDGAGGPSPTTSSSPQPRQGDQWGSSSPPQQEQPEQPYQARGGVVVTGHIELPPQDLERAAMSERLERFYQRYNRSKLTILDATLDRFVGRYEEMFEILTKKYGPEPATPSNFSTRGGFVLPEDDETRSLVSQDPAGCGDGWGGSNSKAGTPAMHHGFSPNRNLPQKNNTGSSMGDGWGEPCGGGGGGWGEPETSVCAPKEESSASKDDWGAGGGGWDAPAETGDGWSTTQINGENTFSNQTQQQQFPTGAEIEEQEQEDEEAEYTTVELCEKKIEQAIQRCAEQRKDLINLLSRIRSSVNDRRKFVEQYSENERKLEQLTIAEEYAQAEQVNIQLSNIAKQIDQCDMSVEVLTKAVEEAAKMTRQGLLQASQTISQQRITLIESREAEEMRVTQYLTERRHTLDTKGEGLRTEMQRASRTKNNHEQEMREATQRKKAIETQAADNTREMQDKIEKQKDEISKLEEEIEELEVRLAQRKKSLRDRRASAEDMQQQLQRIVTDAEKRLQDLAQSMSNEQHALDKAASVVAELSKQVERNDRDKAEFIEEQTSLTKIITSYGSRISHYQQCNNTVQNRVVPRFKEFLEVSVTRVLKARGEDSPLNPKPHKGGSGLLGTLQSELAGIEEQLSGLTAEGTSLRARVREIDLNLPVLESAKKAAAAAKQFKTAVQKTEEMKQALADKQNIEKRILDIEVQVKSLEERRSVVVVQKSEAAVSHRQGIAEFCRQYHAVLTDAWQQCQTLTVEDSGELSTLLAFTTDAERQPSSSKTDADNVVLADARAFLRAMFEEFALLCDVPAEALMNPSPTSPLFANPDRDKEFPSGEHQPAQEIPNENAAGGAAKFVWIDSASEDELKTRLDELNEKLAVGMTDEDYELCGEIQNEIDVVEVALSKCHEDDASVETAEVVRAASTSAGHPSASSNEMPVPTQLSFESAPLVDETAMKSNFSKVNDLFDGPASTQQQFLPPTTSSASTPPTAVSPNYDCEKYQAEKSQEQQQSSKPAFANEHIKAEQDWGTPTASEQGRLNANNPGDSNNDGDAWAGSSTNDGWQQTNDAAWGTPVTQTADSESWGT